METKNKADEGDGGLILILLLNYSHSAHVCTAYMVSDETTRHARAMDSVVHASGPILNGGFASMLGVLVLSVTESYIFKAFFKVMLLVVTFGAAHAILLVPVLLSFIGPKAHMRLEKGDGSHQRLLHATDNLSSSAEGSVSYGSVSDKVIVITPASKKKISAIMSHSPDGVYSKNTADSLDESEYPYQSNGYYDETNHARSYM